MDDVVAIAASMRAAAASMLAKADELLAALHVVPQAQPDPTGWKRSDGRLSENGIDALYTEFALGISGKELETKFEISESGVAKRKAMWRRGQR
jgi:hypothetical protein